jgi:hypothetical protein
MVEQRFEYDFYHQEDNRYLASMYSTVYSGPTNHPLKVGSEVALEDATINLNNCKRLRKCFIRKILQNSTNPSRFVAYLETTNEEAKFPRTNFQVSKDLFDTSYSGTDMDGYDPDLLGA